ncbi:MAG: ATP-binding protein [Anaerolineales bacterium]|nr:ATP-binding protein [Anaerolineales bacterium]
MKSEHLSPQTADTNTVQPMEDEVVTISHAKGSFTFPTNFQLIDAINPYPCG